MCDIQYMRNCLCSRSVSSLLFTIVRFSNNYYKTRHALLWNMAQLLGQKKTGSLEWLIAPDGFKTASHGSRSAISGTYASTYGCCDSVEERYLKRWKQLLRIHFQGHYLLLLVWHLHMLWLSAVLSVCFSLRGARLLRCNSFSLL